MIPARWFGRRFKTILADPPWQFSTWSEKGKGRSAERHYPTMPWEEIGALPIHHVAAKDSVLFLWATAPMMPQALVVMWMWGYRYKSQLVWVKDRIGTGYWTRNAHELLLIGTRGKPRAPLPHNRPTSTIFGERGAHSVKPALVHPMIEIMVDGPYLELFGRRKRERWTVWGNQMPIETPPVV
jgi:N6-adenosine-specific RNA methylase IME4